MTYCCSVTSSHRGTNPQPYNITEDSSVCMYVCVRTYSVNMAEDSSGWHGKRRVGLKLAWVVFNQPGSLSCNWLYTPACGEVGGPHKRGLVWDVGPYLSGWGKAWRRWKCPDLFTSARSARKEQEDSLHRRPSGGWCHHSVLDWEVVGLKSFKPPLWIGCESGNPLCDKCWMENLLP